MAIHRHIAYDDSLFGNGHHQSHKRTEKLPVIPDLRFEYSYLRSIRHHIHIERMHVHSVSAQQHHSMSTKELLDDYEKAKLPEEASQGGAQCLSVQGPSQGSKEVIHVQWKKAIWVTVRDQIMSPFLQGAFWCVVVPQKFVSSSRALTIWQGSPRLLLQPVFSEFRFEIRTFHVCETTSKRGSCCRLASWMGEDLGFGFEMSEGVKQIVD